MSAPGDSVPSTPDATASVAQTKEGSEGPPEGPPPPKGPQGPAGAGEAFHVSGSVTRHIKARPYQRRSDDPVYRPLRIFALDPGVSKLEGALALVNVPYEPLGPGPRGRIFHVVADRADPVCNLEDRHVLLQQGFNPSRSDRRFHNQMVYAVCSSVHAAFKAALGRDPVWGFGRGDGDDADEEDKRGPGMLTIRPRHFQGRNAYYDKGDGSLNFGYFTAEHTTADRMKDETVYTCLSHDIVSHELTHALLDGLRARLTIPTRIDVLAFHEAFADLVAVFQHFSYREVVLTAIQKARGTITDGLLTDLARPLGLSPDRPSPIRSAVDRFDAEAKDRTPRRYNVELPVHDLGSVLVAAVFDAFNAVYTRKTQRYVRLATGGSGQLPMGELPAGLQDVLAEEASQLASQFLNICIRAVDYCPPADLELGEFLRAVITADRELVPADPWGYREAWIDAFRGRGILPTGVSSMDEEALVWRAPSPAIKPIRPLSFARLRFSGDPGRAASAHELRRQAREIGRAIAATNPEAFGLLQPGDRGACLPRIESVRSARRVGPDGQVLFDIVAEITQHCVVKDGQRRGTLVYGGSTVILGPEGEVRYVIGKGVGSKARIETQLGFVQSERGMAYWHEQDGLTSPRSDILKMLHGL